MQRMVFGIVLAFVAAVAAAEALMSAPSFAC